MKINNNSNNNNGGKEKELEGKNDSDFFFLDLRQKGKENKWSCQKKTETLFWITRMHNYSIDSVWSTKKPYSETDIFGLGKINYSCHQIVHNLSIISLQKPNCVCYCVLGNQVPLSLIITRVFSWRFLIHCFSSFYAWNY